MEMNPAPTPLSVASFQRVNKIHNASFCRHLGRLRANERGAKWLSTPSSSTTPARQQQPIQLVIDLAVGLKEAFTYQGLDYSAHCLITNSRLHLSRRYLRPIQPWRLKKHRKVLNYTEYTETSSKKSY